MAAGEQGDQSRLDDLLLALYRLMDFVSDTLGQTRDKRGRVRLLIYPAVVPLSGALSSTTAASSATGGRFPILSSKAQFLSYGFQVARQGQQFAVAHLAFVYFRFARTDHGAQAALQVFFVSRAQRSRGTPRTTSSVGVS